MWTKLGHALKLEIKLEISKYLSIIVLNFRRWRTKFPVQVIAQCKPEYESGLVPN